MKSQAWNIYKDGKKIDTVFFDDDLDKDYVLDSLISHDNYDSNITIRKWNMGKNKMSQRKGGLSWTKFDGATYTPLGLRTIPRKKTAQKIAKCLKSKGAIKGYRILEADRKFKNDPKTVPPNAKK